MTETLVQRVREGRTSGAVLKARLSNIRARNATILVFVFEGVDDVGPYTTWISRIDESLTYEPLPGTGKDQVLDLRARLLADRGGLGAGVYLFVDRDFDDLKGQPEGPDVYCTDTYSIENTLVCPRALLKMLTDEFRCTAENSDRECVAALFGELLAAFNEAMREPNKRIYRARKLGIGARITEPIGRYVDISVRTVTATYTDDTLRELVELTREPSPQECPSIDSQFVSLNPQKHYRGKFLMAFFLRWLEELAMERKNGTTNLFTKRTGINFSAQQLSLGWLAARCEVPESLRRFVSQIPRASEQTAET